MTRMRIGASALLVAAGGVVIAATFALLAWASPASPAPRLRIEDAYIPQPASPDAATAYFTVVDSGGAGDELIGLTSNVAAGTMIYRGTVQSMQMVAALRVPAHGRLVFSPSEYHVMIEKPVRRLRQGEHVQLTFHFRRSAAIVLQAPVRPVGYRPDGG
jgi:periplasmic copper chaperone A